MDNAGDVEGLPAAFTHTNFHAWAAVGAPGDLAIVGWAGSGRGPRLPAVAWLLSTAGEAGDEVGPLSSEGRRTASIASRRVATRVSTTSSQSQLLRPKSVLCFATHRCHVTSRPSCEAVECRTGTDQRDGSQRYRSSSR